MKRCQKTGTKAALVRKVFERIGGSGTRIQTTQSRHLAGARRLVRVSRSWFYTREDDITIFILEGAYVQFKNEFSPVFYKPVY